MTRVRVADLPDMGKIVELGIELHDQSIYADVKPDNLKIRKLVGDMILSKNGEVFVIVDDNDEPQGFLLGMVTEFFFSKERYATDVSFYIRKGHRNHARSIIQAFIDWASKKAKVVEVKLAISSGMDTENRTGTLYELMGFKNIGGMYIMRINQ